MNKRELIAAVVDKTELSKKDVEKVFKEVFQTIKEAMAARDKVAIKGFGTFASKQRAAKTGRHPKTGKKIKIPARVVPAFTAGSDLKEAVAKTTLD